MQKNSFVKCLIIENKRGWLRYELYLSIIGVVCSLGFSLESRGMFEDVLITYIYATELSGMMVSYVFCSLAYATVFCEDREHSYIRYQILRMGIKKYVLIKVISIYMQAFMTMVIGSILFAVICRSQIPWITGDSEEIVSKFSGCYVDLIANGQYITYCLMYSGQLGLLAGTLSVCSAWISLYISNKVMVLILPVLIYQILLEYSGKSIMTVFSFRAYNKFFDQDWQCFLFVLTLSIVPVIALTAAIYRKIKRIL